MVDEKFMTVDDLAEMLRIRPGSLRHILSRQARNLGTRFPKIPRYTFGRSVRFRREEIERWIVGCRVA